MKLITMPRIRLAQLQTLTEDIIQIVTPLTEVSSETAALSDAFSVFQQGMVKNQAYSDKFTLDSSRDNITSGFFKSVESELLFPVEESSKNQLEEVVSIAEKYGFQVNRLSYNEQTAQTDNMLTELKALDLSAFPGLERWITPIQDANTAFKTASHDYLEDVVEADETPTASSAAITVQEAIKKLFTMLFAHLQVSASDALISAYKELDTLVDSYK